MRATHSKATLRQIDRLIRSRRVALPDRELVESYLERRDETAFAALVERHGPMVLGVCRSVLRHNQDAEDAFQATFLVLARKAGSIRRRNDLGSWLHGVAYRVSCKALTAGVRRRALETKIAVPPPAASADDLSWREVRAILHAELAALPERLREPLVLCYLQGLTQDEAAQRLGCTAATVKGRLQRGRNALRRRLEWRGLGLPVALGALALTGQALAVPVPSVLVNTTVQAVFSVAGKAISPVAAALAREMGHSAAAKLGLMGAAVLMAAGLAGGTALLRLKPATSEEALAAVQATTERHALGIDEVGRPERPEPSRSGQENNLTPVVQAKDWHLFRGDSRRSAMTQGGAPRLKDRWRKSIYDKIPEPETGYKLHDRSVYMIELALKSCAQRKDAVLLGLFPILAGDKLFYRSYGGVEAVNLLTGDYEWVSMALAGLDALGKDSNKKGDLDEWFTAYGKSGNPDIIFENSMVGTLSTDGVRVYAVDDLGLPPHPNAIQGRRSAWNMSSSMSRIAERSRLVAIDIETGKLVWERGDPEYRNNELAGSYFLGPLLPVAGRLYLLIEKDEQSKLACLEPEEGKATWILPLGKASIPLVKDPSRRIHAVHLAYADGMLICPTHDGAVFGVDLGARKVAWTFSYQEKPKDAPAKQDDKRKADKPAEAGPKPFSIGAWSAAVPVLVDDKVVFTAPDSKALCCLNRKDGKLIWKTEPRDALYLAGVFQGKVVLVGKDDCRALSLADGNKQLWRVETGPPCGVGVASSTSYYLPLATGELCTIDLTGGRISARTSSPNKEPLGNILIHDGVLISQTPTEVVCYGPKKEKPKK